MSDPRERGLPLDPFEALFADPWLLRDSSFQRFVRTPEWEAPLRTRALDVDAPTDSRLTAASALCFRGDATGEDVLTELLEKALLCQASDRAPLRRVLTQLDYYLSDLGVPLVSPRLCAALLATLDARDPDVLEQAIQTVGIFEVPGAWARFRALLDAPQPASKRRVAFWLSRSPTPETPELLDRLATLAKAEPDATASGEFLDAIAWTAWGDGPAASTAGEVLAALLETGLRPGNMWSAAHALARRPLPIFRPLFERMMVSERTTSSAGCAMLGLARLDGVAALDRLRRSVADPDLGWAALEAIGELAGGSGDPEITEELICLARPRPATDTYAAYKERLRRTRVLETALAVGGIEDEMLEALLEGLETCDRCALRWRRARRSPRAASRALEEAGVRVEGSTYAIPDSGSLRDFFEHLEARGACVRFDPEDDDPPRLNVLVRNLAWASGARFTPEVAWQEESALQFVVSGRRYHVPLDIERGDWLDHIAVVRTVNLALADTGAVERFLRFDTDPQSAYYLLAPPRAVDRVAHAFDLPLVPLSAVSPATG